MGSRRRLHRALSWGSNVGTHRESTPKEGCSVCVHGRRGQIGAETQSSLLGPRLTAYYAQPNGFYGTSVKLNWVMDPNRGIMLAHRMNGEMLRPDHGKPLRAVIPGQIGGRSVKWLKKLILTASPRDNLYHI